MTNGYTSIKNDLTLKHGSGGEYGGLGYTSIKNDLTLKLVPPRVGSASGYTSIKNDLTLKHDLDIAPVVRRLYID